MSRGPKGESPKVERENLYFKLSDIFYLFEPKKGRGFYFRDRALCGCFPGPAEKRRNQSAIAGKQEEKRGGPGWKNGWKVIPQKASDSRHE